MGKVTVGIPVFVDQSVSVLSMIGNSRKDEINRKRNGSFTTDSSLDKRRERESRGKEGDRSKSKSSSTLPQKTTVPKKSLSYFYPFDRRKNFQERQNKNEKI